LFICPLSVGGQNQYYKIKLSPSKQEELISDFKTPTCSEFRVQRGSPENCWCNIVGIVAGSEVALAGFIIEGEADRWWLP
jgi:hypothetical protein